MKIRTGDTIRAVCDDYDVNGVVLDAIDINCGVIDSEPDWNIELEIGADAPFIINQKLDGVTITMIQPTSRLMHPDDDVAYIPTHEWEEIEAALMTGHVMTAAEKVTNNCTRYILSVPETSVTVEVNVYTVLRTEDSVKIGGNCSNSRRVPFSTGNGGVHVRGKGARSAEIRDKVDAFLVELFL